MEFYKGFDNSLLQRLSAIAPEAVERFTQTALFSAVQSLSGQPIDPYERLKLKYFGPDYKFPTLQDIEVPEDFNPETYGKYIMDYQKNFTDTMNQSLSGYHTAATLSGSLDTKLVQMSSIEPFTLSDEMIKNNIRFNEFIQTVTMNDIYNNPYETNEKIVTFYVNNLKQRY
jgi:hypothetical protein